MSAADSLGQQFRPYALDDSGVARYKSLARDAFTQARSHRQAGNLNAADEATRFGAAYRESARSRDSRGGGRTTWRWGDIRDRRVLP